MKPHFLLVTKLFGFVTSNGEGQDAVLEATLG